MIRLLGYQDDTGVLKLIDQKTGSQRAFPRKLGESDADFVRRVFQHLGWSVAW